MKTIYTKVAAASIAALSIFAHANNAFAENEYGIEYTGGEPLSASNVTVDPSLADLTPLYGTSASDVTFSNSDKWESGYLKIGSSQCRPYHFVRVWDSNRITETDDVHFVLSDSLYDVKIQINKIILNTTADLSEDGDAYVVGLSNGRILSVGYDSIYSDAECTTEYGAGFERVRLSQDERIFVQTNVKLYKRDTNELFTSDKLYFGVVDIDAAQSYKILNSEAMFTDTSMYAVSEDAFTGGNGLDNMFVASGNYIYSEGHFQNSSINTIFVKVPVSVQSEGLDIVFGFADPAGSEILYYAKQHNIQYESDENGTITGTTTEDIISGNLASGSTEESEEGFVFEHWVADVDVVLDDGTEIEAGDPINSDQLSHIVVTEDIVLTAIHKKDVPEAPNTGVMTHGGISATQIVLSVLGFAICAAVIKLLPMMFRKRIKF